VREQSHAVRFPSFIEEDTVTRRHLRMRCGLLGLAIALGGCVFSVESVITASGATFDPRLVGEWEEVGGSDRAVVARSARNGYAIEYTSDDTVSRFEARLGRLGDRLVLDVSRVPRESGPPKPHPEPQIARHLAYVLDIGENEIRASLIDADSLAAALRVGQVRLAYTRSDSSLILHGTTEELRAALGPYLASADALERPTVFRRVPRARNGAAAPPTPADTSGTRVTA
jgi:hypothetical protein